MAKKIVVTSGKGGVGKTTILANLGVQMALKGKRICLIDLDFGLNNLDVCLGLEMLVQYDIIDYIEKRCRAKQALIEVPSVKNLFVMPSTRSFGDRNIQTENLKELINDLNDIFDYILLDCPAGIDSGFHRAIALCDEALVVVTSQLSSLRDADKVLSLVRAYGVSNIKMAVNRLRGDLVIDGKMLSASQIENVLKEKVIGVIPEEDNVFLYNAGCIPTFSESVKAFKIMADNLINNKNKTYNYLKKYRGFWGSIKRRIKRSI